MKNPVLKIENLNFGYGLNPLFTNLSLDLHEKEAIWLIGDNGSGKTTLLKLLYGFLSPVSGRLLHTLKSDEIVLVDSESNGLYYDLSAKENLIVWDRQCWKQKNMTEIAEEWGFKNWNVASHLPVSYFSTGMKRRLALMRLCASSAKLWLIDEPMLGLDQRSAAVFVEKLKSHLSAGGACILSSHEDRGLAGIASLRKFSVSATTGENSHV